MNKSFVKVRHRFVIWVFHHLGFSDKAITKINQLLGNDDEELKAMGDFVWKLALIEAFVLPFVIWLVIKTGGL